MATKWSDPDIQNQVEQNWSRLFEPALRMKTPLRTIGLANTQYENEIPEGGTTVRVSQVKDDGRQSDQRSIGQDSNSWNAGKLDTGYVDLKLEYNAQDAIEWDEDVSLYTILNPSPQSIDLITNRIARRINNTMYGKVNPDTTFTSVATLDASEVLKGTVQAAKDYWPEMARKFLVVSPDYYGNLLGEEKFINLDYSASPSAVPLGVIAKEIFGWTVIQDNSRTGKYALGLNPDWLLYAERPADVKFYDLSASRQDIVGVRIKVPYGSVLSNNGSKLHYTWTA